MIKIVSFCRVRILTLNKGIHLYKFGLLQMVLCEMMSTLISLWAAPKAPYKVVLSVFHLPALKGWRTLSFDLGQHQSSHPCHNSTAASKPQNTKIDIDCVCTKQSWAKNFIPESDFSPPFKTSLRIWVTRETVWQERGGRSSAKHSLWSDWRLWANKCGELS